MNFLLTPRKRNEFKRFMKFATVGAAGAMTDIVILNVLIQLAGLPKLTANTISVSIAIVQNFLLNRRWTFPESRQRQASAQLFKFVLISLIGLTINNLIFRVVDHSLTHFWHSWIDNTYADFVSYNFAKLFSIGIVLFWNFGANRLWTYKGLTPSPEWRMES